MASRCIVRVVRHVSQSAVVRISGSSRCISSSSRLFSEGDLSSSHVSGLTLWGNGKGMGLDVQPSRPALYQPTPLNVFMKRYYYLLKGLGVWSRKARVGGSSEALYRSIEEQATQNVWWTALGIPKTWITEHALLSLHMWLLHNRFKVDYNVPGDFNGRRMQEQLFERFWEDTVLRIRNAGVAEISVNKQLENVQKITFDDMFGYDAAIKVMDDDNMEFAAAVWKGVFREDENANTESVLRLADYVRREVIDVMTQPKEDVYRGWLTWGPCVGETPEIRLDRQRRMLEGEWREAFHPDGRLFFYHTATHETRWEPPSEGLYERRRFALLKYMESKGAEGKPSSAVAASGDKQQLPK